MKYLILSLIVLVGRINGADQGLLVPGAPKQHHRHLQIIIDKDSPVLSPQEIALTADKQRCCCTHCSNKMKVALLSGGVTIIGAAISAGVTIALSNCK